MMRQHEKPLCKEILFLLLNNKKGLTARKITDIINKKKATYEKKTNINNVNAHLNLLFKDDYLRREGRRRGYIYNLNYYDLAKIFKEEVKPNLQMFTIAEISAVLNTLSLSLKVSKEDADKISFFQYLLFHLASDAIMEILIRNNERKIRLEKHQEQKSI